MCCKRFRSWFLSLIVIPFVCGSVEGQIQSTSHEENAVYSVLLEQFRSENQENYRNARDLVLLSSTFTRKDIVDWYDGRKHKELLADFKQANRVIVSLGDLPITHYHTVSESEVNRLFAAGETLYKQAVANKKPNEFILGTEYWIPFYRKYPEAVGLHKVSRVGFNRKKTLALVNVTFESNLVGFSRMYVLKREKGTWVILEYSGEESIS